MQAQLLSLCKRYNRSPYDTDAVYGAAEIGTASISTVRARNPFYSFIFCPNLQVFAVPVNRSPYQLLWNPGFRLNSDSAAPKRSRRNRPWLSRRSAVA